MARPRPPRSSRAAVRAVTPGMLAILGPFAAGCASPIVKPEAFDPAVLQRIEARGGLLEAQMEGEEYVVARSVEWMRLRPGDHLSFVGLRPGEDKKLVYCLALECAPERDLLAVRPLGDEETPLTVLADPVRKRQLAEELLSYRKAPRVTDGVVALSLRELIDKNKLGPPIPNPRRVIAVAANYPTHLTVDLATEPSMIEAIAKTPPRLFVKYPPQPPPGTTMPSDLPFRGVIGPYDDIVYPELTWLPKDEAGTSNAAPTALDYEVELGVVLGRDLTWADVEHADDATLYAAIAGYMLVSDVKARNPQVYERVLSRDQSPESWAKDYLTGDADTDLILGNWDDETVAWWSYAASLGDFTACGPFFIATEGEPSMPPHDLMCARTYGTSKDRGFPIPGDRQPELFYLRQCSRASEDAGSPDKQLWTVPQILRAALDPKQALASTPASDRLYRGDVIALGTPGGITLTVRGRTFYRILGKVLFWWNARDWHDAFFGKDVANYLHQGDRLFLWGEGLGCQNLAIRRVAWPPPPGVTPTTTSN
jgi:2-keto-4-pentenoate hydratase/2-oxohepta-3-ene-1,7-dioic acid hydratase in catechol pathway